MKEQPLFTLSHYTITYEPCPPLLRGCNDRLLSAEEITEACELLLASARCYDCRYWLLNGRSHQQPQPQTLHEWIRDEYFPRIWRELGSGVCLSFVVPEPVWIGLPALDYGQPPNSLVHGVRVSWFTEEGAALEWLARQRAQGR